MILSMTGYGTGTAKDDLLTVAVEIRTVNHRFLDLHIRVPREYQFLENDAASLIRGAISRGRVDAGVTVINPEADAVQIDYELAHRYLTAVNKLNAEYASLSGESGKSAAPDMARLLSLPGVLRNNDEAAAERAGETAENIAKLMKESLQTALESVLAMRRREGAALRDDMLQNLSAIESNTDEIRKLSQNAPDEYFEKLRLKLDRLLAQSGHQGAIDPQRLAGEAAILADKCDISEEIARMASHIEQYRALADAGEKTGKKLDFLLQEMQREANTILSKSDNLEITHRGISIKTDIEKLREQVQNVE
ncbi:MAG: YicC family protein [Acidobacteriota bacterium]|jgi:uncharacterized protein (TIGR00255 family)|nr:YicC family protein [Acidobacteriota bacterium]